MGAMASQITSLAIVYPIVYSGADERKYQSSASPSFVRGIHRWPMNSPHQGPVTRKMFPFDDVIMAQALSAASDRSSNYLNADIPSIGRPEYQQMLLVIKIPALFAKFCDPRNDVT